MVGETVSTLDNVLNIVVPVICIGFFGMLIYKAFKPQMKDLMSWIRGLSAKKEDKQQYQYDYKSSYMIPGDIQYK